MIKHYLSNNNKLCYSNFSSQNHQLNGAYAGTRSHRSRGHSKIKLWSHVLEIYTSERFFQFEIWTFLFEWKKFNFRKAFSCEANKPREFRTAWLMILKTNSRQKTCHCTKRVEKLGSSKIGVCSFRCWWLELQSYLLQIFVNFIKIRFYFILWKIA